MSSQPWERTKEILEQALRLAAEERQAYLESECGSDAVLRGEVESLIASHEEAGSQFLCAPAPDVLRLAPPRTFAPGTRLGSYQIIELLGAGGMGEVYRAKDPRLDRELAIKVLSLDRCSQPEALSRFSGKPVPPARLITPTS